MSEDQMDEMVEDLRDFFGTFLMTSSLEALAEYLEIKGYVKGASK